MNDIALHSILSAKSKKRYSGEKLFYIRDLQPWGHTDYSIKLQGPKPFKFFTEFKLIEEIGENHIILPYAGLVVENCFSAFLNLK